MHGLLNCVNTILNCPENRKCYSPKIGYSSFLRKKKKTNSLCGVVVKSVILNGNEQSQGLNEASIKYIPTHNVMVMITTNLVSSCIFMLSLKNLLNSRFLHFFVIGNSFVCRMNVLTGQKQNSARTFIL